MLRLYSSVWFDHRESDTASQHDDTVPVDDRLDVLPELVRLLGGDLLLDVNGDDVARVEP
jgi:hypothetical protein